MRGRIITILSVIMVLSLAVSSFVFPEQMMKWVERGEKDVGEKYRVSLTANENAFDSFSDKFKLLSQKENWQQASKIFVTKEISSISTKHLTEAVNRELRDLFSTDYFDSLTEFTESDLKEWDMISLYSSQADNPLNGMLFWQLHYETKEVEMELILDYETEKICTLVFLTDNATSNLTTFYNGDYYFNDECRFWIQESVEQYYRKSADISNSENVKVLDLAEALYGYHLFVPEALASSFYIVYDGNTSDGGAGYWDVEIMEKKLAGGNLLLQSNLCLEKGRGIVTIGIWNFFEMIHL